MQRIEKRTDERVEKAVEQVAGEASAVVAANLNDPNGRAERVPEAAGQIEPGLGWVAASCMALALIPVAVIALGILAMVAPDGQERGVGPLFGWAWSVV